MGKLTNISGLASSYCQSSTSVTISGSPAGGTFTGTGMSGTTFTPSALNARNIIYTYKDANNCTNIASQTVTVYGKALPNFTITQACNQSAVIAYTGTTPDGSTFSWDFNGGTIVSGTAGTTGPFTIRWSNPGSKTISVQVSNPACSASSSQTYVVPAAPVLSIALNASYCSNSTPITLNATPAGGVFKVNNITATTFTPSSTGAHTILYTYTDASSCVYTKTLPVTVNPLPIVSFSGLAASYCQGAAGSTLSGSPAGGVFTGIGTSGTSFTTGTLGDRPVTYTFTDANGCSNTSTQSTIVQPIPAVSFSGLGTSYCNSSIAVPLTGSPAGGTFSGTGISGTAFVPSVNGTYPIQYTATVNGCTNSQMKTVGVSAGVTPITISASPSNSVCKGTTVTFTSSPFSQGTVPSFIWKKNGMVINGETASSFSSNTLLTGDLITCVPVPNSGCTSSPVSNAITMTVTPGNNYFTYFDGVDDRVRIPAHASYNNLNNFTMEAVVLISTDAPNFLPVLCSPFVNNTGGYFAISGNRLTLKIGNYITATSNTFSNIRDNRLHKVAVSRSSGTLTFYLDGVAIGTSIIGGGAYITSELYIGYSPTYSWFYKGYIKNVRFWNVAKGEGELHAETLTASTLGLIGNWEMSECDGQVVTDYSSLANHGQCGTSAFTDAADPMRMSHTAPFETTNAFQCIDPVSGGTNYVQINHNDSYNVAGNDGFTIEAWIKSGNTVASSTSRQAIVSKRTSNNTGYCFGVKSGRLFFMIGNTEYLDTKTTYNLSAANTCNHVAIVRNSSLQYTFYVNGVAMSTFSSVYSINTSPSTTIPIMIGKDNGTGIIQLNYLIDDIRFWNNARSQTEIAAGLNTIYNRTTPNLIGYYRFKEDKAAQWVIDGSITDNYGVIQYGNAGAFRVTLSCTSSSRIGFSDTDDNNTSAPQPSETVIARLYPNPFENNIRLQILHSEALLTIQVLDASGQVVYTKENHPAGEELVLGEEFPPGIYLIHFINEPGLKPMTFVKMK